MKGQAPHTISQLFPLMYTCYGTCHTAIQEEENKGDSREQTEMVKEK